MMIVTINKIILCSSVIVNRKGKKMRSGKANKDIREAAKRAGVMLWEVALRLGISEATMTRKMRIEMSEEDKEKVLAAIDAVRAEREG